MKFKNENLRLFLIYLLKFSVKNLVKISCDIQFYNFSHSFYFVLIISLFSN